MLTFISYWRTAAVVLCDLASTAYYIGGIVEQAIGPCAPWFILGVMLFSYAVRSVYIESCSLFVRGGVYKVVKEAMGGFLAKLSVSALMFDYILTGPTSGVSAGQYIMSLVLRALQFASPNVYLERYLAHPRHVEMQVLADSHGTTLALGERECSIQRRHQKLLEETPAVGLNPGMRAAMASAAVKAAAAVEYENAGTIEFIVSGDDFYFLEMNTRLQVEHPVTESVLGIDLVREQIRVARGERIPTDGYGDPRGHAIEFRINAEDPLRNFMPAPRRVQRYAPPTGPGVRVDSGIRPHQDVSPHFDSLLLKLIVFAADRSAAIGRGRRALGELVLTGPRTTVPFHRAILDEPDFIEGQISTGFIEAHPALMERAREFAAQRSPLEPLFGGGEVAAAIAAGVVAVSES